MNERVTLGELVAPAEPERAGSREFAVLSMTSSAGLVPQSSIFKKSIASRDISNYKVVRPNQLVVGIHVDEGALGFSGTNQTGIVSPAYSIWKLKNAEMVHIPFLDRFVRSPQAIAYFISKYRETAERRGKLTHDQFLALSVPFPPITEQRRISAILDQADALRSKRQEALAELDSLAQSIFIEMFGDPLTNIRNWNSKLLGDLLESITNGVNAEQNDAESGWPITRIETIWNGVIDSARVKYIEPNNDLKERYQLHGGDILFSHINSPDQIAKTAIYQGDPSPMIHGINLLRLRCLSNEVNAIWLLHLLKQPSIRTYFRTRCKKAVNQASLNQQDIKSLRCIVPPLELQVIFADRVSAASAFRSLHEQSALELDKLFLSLQQRAFRGEL